MRQDLRLAFRLMVRQPLMATTAIVALTVGIGLAGVGFAAMEALLFSKLPLVIALLIAAGLAATWVPLRRALRIRPQEALKAE